MILHLHNATYARTLTVLRRACGLTQAGLGELAGLDVATIGRAAEGRSTRSSVMAVVGALGLAATADDLEAIVAAMTQGRRVRVVRLEVELEPVDCPGGQP